MTDQLIETSPRTAEPAPGHRSRRLRKLAVVVATATSAITGVVAAAPSSANAQAIVTPYFSLDAEITCDPTRNTVRVTVAAGAQPAYRGMTVQYQTWVSVGSLSGWSSWSSNIQLWGSNQQLQNRVTTVPNGQHAQAYVQLRYWNGSGWSRPQGTWATKRMISLLDYKTPYYNGFCYT